MKTKILFKDVRKAQDLLHKEGPKTNQMSTRLLRMEQPESPNTFEG